ncbi:hypothetical protein ACQYAD_08075 [Neobacillus sp. SM06]|uniref:hypothetical protein n=1 Tax=Neobacillus sp. SM06 TaxID=3422492 RepID=UPI003D27EFE2
MKKMIVTGALAAVMIAGGGTGAYLAYAKGNDSSPAAYMQQQGVNVEQMSNTFDSKDIQGMQDLMKSGNVNFGQMKPYMQKMHPDLSNQQLEDMYKGMNGTGGSSNSANFQGMNGSGSSMMGNGNL